MRRRCYGDSCCLDTDEKINFDYMLKDDVVGRRAKFIFYAGL